MNSRYSGLIWLLGLYLFGGCAPTPPAFEVETRGRLSDSVVYAVSPARKGSSWYALGECLDSATTFVVLHGEELSTKLVGKESFTNARLPTKADFLFSAEVGEWRPLTVPRHVQSRLDFEMFLLGAAEAYGIDLYAPFPFQIRGRAAKLHYRLPACRSGKRPRLRDSLSNQNIEAFGFYTSRQTGRLTTSPDERLHLHFQTPDGALTAHLLEIVPERMEVWLPMGRK